MIILITFSPTYQHKCKNTQNLQLCTNSFKTPTHTSTIQQQLHHAGNLSKQHTSMLADKAPESGIFLHEGENLSETAAKGTLVKCHKQNYTHTHTHTHTVMIHPQPDPQS